MLFLSKPLVAATVLAASLAEGINLNVNDPASVKSAAATIAEGLFKYYDPSLQGLLVGYPSWAWWQAGAMMGSLVHYSFFTGDKSYDAKVAQAIYSQASPTVDFMLPLINGTLGNDDQAFWGLAAMDALEYGLPLPSGGPSDLWFQLANNTFYDFVSRWGVTGTCNGGIKWQIYSDRRGWNYKSSIANGGFLQLAARLARYTGNSGIYGEWAETVFEWMVGVGYIDTTTYSIYDGAGDENNSNCSRVDKHQWSYNAATLLAGSAAMASASGQGSDGFNKWSDRATKIWLNAQAYFFGPFDNSTGVLYEWNCEKSHNCDNDQLSFKAYLARWAVYAAQLLPSLAPSVNTLMIASAQAAAQSCSGQGASTCGTTWWVSGWDGSKGVGQQMSALEVVQGLLMSSVQLPGPGRAGPSPTATATSTAAGPSTTATTSTAAAPTTTSTAAGSAPPTTSSAADVPTTTSTAAAPTTTTTDDGSTDVDSGIESPDDEFTEPTESTQNPVTTGDSSKEGFQKDPLLKLVQITEDGRVFIPA